jgi:hypothetical protein
MVRAIAAQTRNVSFLKIVLTYTDWNLIIYRGNEP